MPTREGARNDAYTRLATLGPRDRERVPARVRHELERLSPYEKCLFWWTEVNMFGLELPGRFDGIPFLRINAERIVGGDRPPSPSCSSSSACRGRAWLGLAEPADRWLHPTDHEVNPLEVHRHPTTVEVAPGSDMNFAA